MKKIIIIILILMLPINTIAISINASSGIVMDMESERILYAKNITEDRLIASITKIMTAVLAIESGKMDEVVKVGDEVLTMYGTNIYIELNEEILIRDLVYGLLLRSGNDAAIVLAKNIGGTVDNFVLMMNKKAKKIGMINTIYKNPHGLDEETKNYSSAYDMAILSSYASKLKEYQEISGTKKYKTVSSNKSYLWYNRNELLTNYKYATGGKTGYTPKAGKTLVTTASKNHFNLTAVTLNDPNMYLNHQNLYQYIYKNYKRYLILDKNSFDIDKNIFRHNVYVKNSFYYPLDNIEKNNIKTIIKLKNKTKYINKEEVGNAIIMLNDKEIHREKIYIKVKEESILKKILKILK
ncbi:MAG: D-alanyl-D-alanine carboxypeptidase family protein [Bacilli bacterium]